MKNKKSWHKASSNIQNETTIDLEERGTQAIKNIAAPQPARMARYLLLKGPSLTNEIAQDCAVINLSATAKKANKELSKQGLKIVCSLPKPVMRNRFDEPCGIHIWKLIEISNTNATQAKALTDSLST